MSADDPTPPSGTPRTVVARSSNAKILAAETVGTCVLMLVGPGSAILAVDAVGVLGVSLAFGFALLAMAYSIGHLSGCHINPAVTLGFLITRKVTIVQSGFHWVGQVVGALLGGLILYIITESGDLDQTGVFAANGWGDKINSSFGIGSAILVEIVFTALLIFVVLSTTTEGFYSGFAGLAAGLTLAMIHLVTIPVDNTSVNPARSIGAAVFAGSDAMSQLWVFLVFPMVGAVLGVLVWLLAHDENLEGTMMGGQAQLLAVRDRMARLADRSR